MQNSSSISSLSRSLLFHLFLFFRFITNLIDSHPFLFWVLFKKMNNAWIGLEKAPQGTLKNKIHLWASFTPHSFFWPYCFLSLLSVLYLYIHRLGLRLLSRVKPSEIFLKSISKEITDVQITYPSRFHLFPLFFHLFFFYENEMFFTLLFIMQSFMGFYWVTH